MKKFLVGIIVVLALAFLISGDNESDILVLATTTSVQDSGLLDVIVPLYETETGITVKYIAVGSGQALELARRGEVDALLVHDPKGEGELAKEGYVVNRQRLMHNSMVIVGPSEDPAGVKEAESAIEAFMRIYETESLFVSRGDDSGTHRLEVSIWQASSITPEENYLSVGSGMGATLTIAGQKNAYALTDKATYLWLKDSLSLVILHEGSEELLNIYHVMQVNPERFELVNDEAGKGFVEFMLSAEIQELIGTFGVDLVGEPLFYPDAGGR